jgi:hypothetical protein
MDSIRQNIENRDFQKLVELCEALEFEVMYEAACVYHFIS